MTHLVAYLLVAGLGSHSFKVRDRCQRSLEVVLFATACRGPVQSGTRHRDPEIRRRCEDVLCRYYDSGFDFTDVTLARLPYEFDVDAWCDASMSPEPGRAYAHVLLDKGYAKWFVLMLLKKARATPKW